MACATVTNIYDRTMVRARAHLMNVQMNLVSWKENIFAYLITDYPYPMAEIYVGRDNFALGYLR